MANPTMRELYQQWYPLDSIPDALGKIGALVVAGKEAQAASYAEIQLQGAHTEIDRLRATLVELARCCPTASENDSTQYCTLCGSNEYDQDRDGKTWPWHKETCPWLIAQALLPPE